MQYSMGEGLADYGFNFLEKVHEPIFLVHRSGKLVKMNEAGRKFLKITKLTPVELSLFVKASVIDLFTTNEASIRRVPLGKGCQLIARSFSGSDHLLLEIVK
jgi:hypothetical protein